MKYLQTNLLEISTEEQLKQMMKDNENLVVVLGRMGPMCIPVYDILEEIEDDYPHVKFAVMGFDNPDGGIIRNHSACRGFMGIPFTMYYKNGEVVKATTSIQNYQQITDILNTNFKS